MSHWPVASRDILGTWLAGLSSDRGRTLLEALGDDAISEQLYKFLARARGVGTAVGSSDFAFV
ncbi:MAG: hypothetical protein GY811_15690 [Myxococcales bacterium]|nr:hypothetical protein [Myxococcales bacterium]